MPYAFTLPDAADVRENSRLRPEQVSAEYADTAALEAEVSERIDKKAAMVNGKLARAASPYPWPFSDELTAIAYPSYDADQRTAETDRQKELATQAVELYALASLYGSAGQLQPSYWKRAAELKAEADELMDELLKSIAFISGAQPENEEASGVAVWTVSTGLVVAEDEYSC